MKRPRLVLFGEASLDGRLTLAPDVLLLYGDERWRASAGSSDVYDWIKSKHQPQAFLEGSGSLVLWNEEPETLPSYAGESFALYEDYLPEDILTRPEHQGWFIVVDSRGRVRWKYKEWPEEEWRGWHLLVLVSERTPVEYLAYLQREGIPYLVAGKQRVDLQVALGKISSELGVECVLSTSPGKLGGALLRADLVDEINIEFFPAVIGGFKTPSLFECPALQESEWPTKLRLISAQVEDGGRVWLRYEVRGED
ncbi:MAG: deaminase [Anaerolineales bacterium]|nr:deaminase [Anaerolineales bacterium]